MQPTVSFECAFIFKISNLVSKTPWLKLIGLKSPHLFKNVFSFIFGLILDAVLVCYVVWVIGFESGLKKIDFRG